MSFNKQNQPEKGRSQSRTPDLKNIQNVFKIQNQDEYFISISKPILLDK